MRLPFTIEVRIEPEVESIIPDGNGGFEATLSANGREAKCCFDATGDTHGTLETALLALLGYRKDEVAQEARRLTQFISDRPGRVM